MRNSKIKKIILLFCLSGFFILSLSWAQEKLFKPFIEKQPNGRVDWGNGYFYGIGQGYLKFNDQSQAKALKAAQAGALSSILQVAARIRVDDQNTLLDLERRQVIVRIQGLVEYEPEEEAFVQKGADSYYQVVFRAPIKGVKGLARKLLTYYREDMTDLQEIPAAQSQAEADAAEPWLVLDARHLSKQEAVQPALFPKIVAENGETVSDVNTVDGQAAVEQGMVQYVVSDTKPEEISSNGRNGLLCALRKLIGPPLAMAQQNKTPLKRGRYIIKNVQQAQGLAHTTLVISQADAKELKAEDNSNRLLKQCRVIVVVSSSVGGVEGALPEWLAWQR